MPTENEGGTIPASIREMLWLDERFSVWKQTGHIPQEDVHHFCSSYMPATLQSLPATGVSLRIEYMGRTGVLGEVDMLDWKWTADDFPSEGLIITVMEKLARDASKLAANNRILALDCAFANCEADEDDDLEPDSSRVLS